MVEALGDGDPGPVLVVLLVLLDVAGPDAALVLLVGLDVDHGGHAGGHDLALEALVVLAGVVVVEQGVRGVVDANGLALEPLAQPAVEEAHPEGRLVDARDVFVVDAAQERVLGVDHVDLVARHVEDVLALVVELGLQVGDGVDGPLALAALDGVRAEGAEAR